MSKRKTKKLNADIKRDIKKIKQKRDKKVMKTPWMMTNYQKIDPVDYNHRIIDENQVILNLKDKEVELIMNVEDYRLYQMGELDGLKMENLYYRGFALDDSGNYISNCLDDAVYYPLEKTHFAMFSVDARSGKYTVILNPETGSWVALELEEYNAYLNGELNRALMENLYLRGLAVDEDGEYVIMNFPKPANYPSVVVVNLTLNCNLRCRYCFANCEPGVNLDMGEGVMVRVIEEMFKMPSKLITFELQGGEPLCNFEGMKRFIAISEELKNKYSKFVKYRTVTNATLINNEFIEFAKRYDLAVCVSLDGPEEMTNQTRVFSGGEGAFSEIMTGVKKLSDEYRIDGAVCTIGQHNMKRGKEIMNFFEEQRIDFKPRPANILGREIENNTTATNGEWADTFIEMHQISKDTSIENYSVHIHEENVYGPVRDYICLRYPCGAAREVISVNPDGTVYPCDGFKGESEFIIGNLLEENLEDILHKESVEKLRNRTHKDIETCRNCLFRAMCCSCCYSAYGAYGTVYAGDPHCKDRKKIFKYLIKDWLDEH